MQGVNQNRRDHGIDALSRRLPFNGTRYWGAIASGGESARVEPPASTSENQNLKSSRKVESNGRCQIKVVPGGPSLLGYPCVLMSSSFICLWSRREDAVVVSKRSGSGVPRPTGRTLQKLPNLQGESAGFVKGEAANCGGEHRDLQDFVGGWQNVPSVYPLADRLRWLRGPAITEIELPGLRG